MSDALEPTDREIPERSPHAARPWLFLLVAIALATLSAGVVTVVARHGGPAQPHGHHTAAGTVHVNVPPEADQGAPVPRLAAIRGLLRERSTAIRHHDRLAFLATVDPVEASFYRSQARMFANLAPVTFSSWTYSMSSASAGLDGGRFLAYHAPAWAPRSFDLEYRIAGFDRAPTKLAQYPTFVDRGGRWYLASLSDFAWRGEVSATDLWDYAPVQEVHVGPVLVLGPSVELAVMDEVAAQAKAAIPKVTSVWGRHWSQRVVLQVPSTQREMGLITGLTGDLSQIAAVTSAEVSAQPGQPKPVGDRVTINPRAWRDLGQIGAGVVLAHELTHVATRADTGAQTPKWLAEGFADYVGFLRTGLPVRSIAAELAQSVRAGRLPTRLPANADFEVTARRLSQAYEPSWLACRYIAKRYGQPALVRFYRSVGTSRLDTAQAVAVALHRVLGLTLSEFTARWRAFVIAKLAR